MARVISPGDVEAIVASQQGQAEGQAASAGGTEQQTEGRPEVRSE